MDLVELILTPRVLVALTSLEVGVQLFWIGQQLACFDPDLLIPITTRQCRAASALTAVLKQALHSVPVVRRQQRSRQDG